MTQKSMMQRWFGSSTTERSGQPLELVRYDSTSKRFEVGEEALSVLRSVNGPMGVISVCGRARQGKSFILNQLLGQSSGFTVAPTHRPCTKGLWMWSSPQERTLPDGSKNYLVCSRGQQGVLCNWNVKSRPNFYSNALAVVPMAHVSHLCVLCTFIRCVLISCSASTGNAGYRRY